MANKTVKTTLLVIAIIGIGLITYYTKWQVALGVFFLIWANNGDYIKK